MNNYIIILILGILFSIGLIIITVIIRQRSYALRNKLSRDLDSEQGVIDEGQNSLKASLINKSILVVDDDDSVYKKLQEIRSNYYLNVIQANNVEQADDILSQNKKFDFIVLDFDMPNLGGWDMLKKTKLQTREIPIIFLTTKTMKEDALKGYKAGADDYLNKPFDSEVLLTKLKAILQRKASNTLADSKKFEFRIGNFHLNSKLRFLKYNDEEAIKLSPKENELLRLLALHENDLMHREWVLTKIWRDDNYVTSRSMDVYIANLRKYLKRDDKVEILNIHDEGFKLVVKTESD